MACHFSFNQNKLWSNWRSNRALLHNKPVFYTSGNRFFRRIGTFGNLIFLLVPSDNRNTRSTCPTSVFTGIGQTLMSRPAETTMHCKVTCNLYKKQAHFSQLFCLQVRSVTSWQLHDRKSRCLRGRQHS